MKSISSSDFEAFKPELCPWAKKETLIPASDLIDKDRQILELQEENRRLQRQLKAGKVNPSQVKQKQKPCTHCLRAGLGNMYHRVCDPKKRKAALKARNKNREQQKLDHDLMNAWKPLPLRHKNKTKTQSNQEVGTMNNELCQACLNEGRSVRQASHPNKERCVFKLMNDDGVTDPVARKNCSTMFFKTIRERGSHEYLNVTKRKVQAPATADTPPEKRTQVTEARRRRQARATARALVIPQVEEDDDGIYISTDPEDMYDEIEDQLMSRNS